jgi:6-phosphogluconolactonase
VLCVNRGGLVPCRGHRGIRNRRQHRLPLTSPTQTRSGPSPWRARIVRIEFPPESAPRHIAFHPSGRVVYVLGERDSRLHVLKAEHGVPSRILGSYLTMPPGYRGRNTPSELDLHPDGATVYVGNRGSDCVTIVSLDEEGGVEIRDHQPTLGRGPRPVRVDPTGGYLLVGNVDSGDVVAFQINDDRSPTPRGRPVDVPSPSSFVFASA